ncbi:hypothetical protein [Empedobacter brevis]|uniref:hypothetical protein n=1 Tax=Empedobacter brevis TaxID=247 RepID=UPI0023F2349A|nr:hypothetical protein [Empedobacter brevis]
MKQLLTFVTVLIFNFNVFGQESEFKTYKNGLIYSEEAISKLGRVVDSLNLKFKTCDVNKKFYAKNQTIGYVVSLEAGNIKQAKQDLENKIPLDEFIRKYPQAEVGKNKLIIKQKYRNYEDKEIVEFEEFDLKSDYGLRIESEDLKLYDKEFKNTWLFRYHKKTDYSEESIEAFYFPENFKSNEIPNKYAIMIGYSDCLIDTTATKFKDKLKDGWVELPKNWQNFSKKKKSKLLDQMRSTRVIGGCSQDSSPRDHAVNIALLSAETYNWSVFLKAHLDIMNDRFERVSDGSYAWGERNTYIKELETLDINVLDLILGISLRVENAATNHYYGNISRIGRALAETKNRNEIEEAILSAVSDKKLDDYNRLLFYFLFRNYNHYIQEEELKKTNEEKLLLAMHTLPDYYTTELLKNEE